MEQIKRFFGDNFLFLHINVCCDPTFEPLQACGSYMGSKQVSVESDKNFSGITCICTQLPSSTTSTIRYQDQLEVCK